MSSPRDAFSAISSAVGVLLGVFGGTLLPVGAAAFLHGRGLALRQHGDLREVRPEGTDSERLRHTQPLRPERKGFVVCTRAGSPQHLLTLALVLLRQFIAFRSESMGFLGAIKKGAGIPAPLRFVQIRLEGELNSQADVAGHRPTNRWPSCPLGAKD